MESKQCDFVHFWFGRVTVEVLFSGLYILSRFCDTCKGSGWIEESQIPARLRSCSYEVARTPLGFKTGHFSQYRFVKVHKECF